MSAHRRTYVVSVYPEDSSVVVEAVGRDERARLEGLEDVAGRIREWEGESAEDDENR